MVDLNFDSKHGFVTGQALNCLLRLVTTVFQHKPRNYYKQLYSICMIILYTSCPLLTKTNSLDVYHDLQLLQHHCCFSNFLEGFRDRNSGMKNKLGCIIIAVIITWPAKLAFLLMLEHDITGIHT